MESEIYRPLEGSEAMRIVTTAPSAFTDDVNCELIHATIQFKYEYLALS